MNSNNQYNELDRPINFSYQTPTASFLKSIKDNDACIEILNQNRILIENVYYKQNIPGSISTIFIRKFILQKLLEALELLPLDFGFVIFDGFRSRELQRGLYDSIYRSLKIKHPNLSENELAQETRKFVAHPHDPGHFEVPPHLSGGAIDIGLTYHGKILNMGTAFDDLTEMASTDFFEKDFDPSFCLDKKSWIDFRKNRRLLFHSLSSVGFTNWKHEWWHFDIGNCVWAQEFGLSWIYGPMKLNN
ncbi:MAG: M15 family metallopeptidase [Bacteriovoracaceae bacterium]|nr:M15 family metallopeptidase [Bacteriovoracaceae bacterium]